MKSLHRKASGTKIGSNKITNKIAPTNGNGSPIGATGTWIWIWIWICGLLWVIVGYCGLCL